MQGMNKNNEITLDQLAAMIKVGFDEVHKEFDNVYERFDDVYKRFDTVDTKFVEVHEKIDALDASLRVEIKATREEMRQGFTNVIRVLGDHEERITKIEHELAP